MENQRILRDAQQLGDADKLELAQTLLNSVQFDELPVTPEEAAIVEQRLADMNACPEDRLSSGDVWNRIKRKYL